MGRWVGVKAIAILRIKQSKMKERERILKKVSIIKAKAVARTAMVFYEIT